MDRGTDSKEPGHHFGVVGNEYHPRPPAGLRSQARLCGDVKTLHEQLNDFTFNKRLAIDGPHGPNDNVLLFELAGEVRVAAWTTAADTHPVEIPASSGKFTSVDRTGRKVYGVAENPMGLEYSPSTEVTILKFPQTNALLQTAASLTRLPLEITFDMPGSSPKSDIRFANFFPQTILGIIGQRRAENWGWHGYRCRAFGHCGTCLSPWRAKAPAWLRGRFMSTALR